MTGPLGDLLVVDLSRSLAGPRATTMLGDLGAWVSWKTADPLERLAAARIPAGEVRGLDEVYTWDQTLSQGLVVEVEHAASARFNCRASAAFVRARGEGAHPGRPPAAPPVLDGDGQAIRDWPGAS